MSIDAIIIAILLATMVGLLLYFYWKLRRFLPSPKATGFIKQEFKVEDPIPGDIMRFYERDVEEDEGKEDAEFVEEQNYTIKTGKQVPDWMAH